MPSILVVDDDPDFVEAARLVLDRASFTVRTAANGNQALAQALRSPPDLIILDVMMEGVLDGVDTAHQFEENKQLHGVPIIMVSSIAHTPVSWIFPTDEYLPIDAWLSKPVSPDKLLQTVQKLLRPAQAA